MNLNFITKIETDKLIIEASDPKDEFLYVGEIHATSLVDFNEIKELLEQRMFKTIIKTEEMLVIKIGIIRLEMFSKFKA